MNNTKWDEIRAAMCDLAYPHPQWRTRDARTGYESPWDGEWFYHLRSGGYDSIEWLDVATPTDQQRADVREVLRKIHVPGEETTYGFRVYGYMAPGRGVDYL